MIAKNVTKLTKDIYNKSFKQLFMKNIIKLIGLFYIYLIIVVVLALTKKYEVLIFIILILPIYIIVFILNRINLKKLLSTVEYIKAEPTYVYVFNEDYFEILITADGLANNHKFEYIYIYKITQTKDFIFLQTMPTTAYFIEKKGFVYGATNELLQFINQKLKEKGKSLCI